MGNDVTKSNQGDHPVTVGSPRDPAGCVIGTRDLHLQRRRGHGSPGVRPIRLWIGDATRCGSKVLSG